MTRPSTILVDLSARQHLVGFNAGKVTAELSTKSGAAITKLSQGNLVEEKIVEYHQKIKYAVEFAVRLLEGSFTSIWGILSMGGFLIINAIQGCSLRVVEEPAQRPCQDLVHIQRGAMPQFHNPFT